MNGEGKWKYKDKEYVMIITKGEDGDWDSRWVYNFRGNNEDGVFVNKDKGKSRHEYIGKKEKISITYSFGEFHNRIILKN